MLRSLVTPETMPEFGATSTCKTCGIAIRFEGRYWSHLGVRVPRHPAVPTFVKPIDAWESNVATSGVCEVCSSEANQSIVVVEVREKIRLRICRLCAESLAGLIADVGPRLYQRIHVPKEAFGDKAPFCIEVITRCVNRGEPTNPKYVVETLQYHELPSPS